MYTVANDFVVQSVFVSQSEAEATKKEWKDE